MESAEKSCMEYSVTETEYAQDEYNDPEADHVSKYYFPGRLHDLIRIITIPEKESSDKTSYAMSSENCFTWPYNYGIFNTVHITLTTIYYYSNC
jgi:hypothetical protein